MKSSLKNNTKVIFIVIVTSVILLAILILILAVSLEPDKSFKRMALENTGTKIDLNQFIDFESPISLSNKFPFKFYANSDNWKTINDVNSDLRVLNERNADHRENQKVLSQAITTNLTYWNVNELDSLNLLLIWSEQFSKAFPQAEETQLFYASIYDYWMDFLAAKLKRLSDENDIKYLYKYKYLKERCIQSNHGVGERNDNYTKIINYVIEKRWYYLFVERLWRSTSVVFKVLMLLFIGITLYSYYCAITKHLIKK